MKRTGLCLALLLSVLVGVTACGGGGGGSAGGGATPSNEVRSSISGSALKGPIDGAVIQVFYFDDDGTPVEIVAVNAPVLTDINGAFGFTLNGKDLMGVTSPLIVRSSGGSMYGGAAPALEAIVNDPLPLTYHQVNLTCNLSTASAVAAGLLRKRAQTAGIAPSRDDARQIIARVAENLQVDLASDPSSGESSLWMLNNCLDQNLDLIDTPANNPAVEALVAYLVANLSSASRTLDAFMDDPASPGTDIAATFTPFASGILDTLVPAGPEGFVFMQLSAGSAFIENSGTDSVAIETALFNALGEPSAELALVSLGLWDGQGSLNSTGLDYGLGQVQAELTSLTAGDNIVRAEFTLPNGNTIVQLITVTAVDPENDLDGDGFSDAEEQRGWLITIDALGYGSAAEGKLLENRTVTSDPAVADTDGDGLDDFIEYLIRTDPRSVDTDGDGLTDEEEWNRWFTSPTSADTDGDARGPAYNLPPKAVLFDGNELFLLSTSPTLADTDGDGWTDYEEFDHPQRSPRVADLPRLELLVEDQVDVRLDVNYAEELGQTSQYGTVLTKSSTVKTSRYDARTIGHSLKVGASYNFGLLGGASVSTEYTFSSDQTVAFTAESSKTAQSAYSRYNTEARTRTESAASGSMTMGIRLKNTGKLTYTISQLGITARQWLAGAVDPQNPTAPGAFSTVATLVPSLGGGLTLAPGSISPVLQLQASDLNADRVKELLARPDSLRLEPAYYELENAEELNFAYLEEITGPRTAMIFLDYGDGRVEEYRVAALVERNYDGTFAGVTLGEVMDAMLSIPYETRPRRFVDPNAATNENVLYSVRGLATVASDLDQGFWTVILPARDVVQAVRDFEDVTVYGGEQVILAYIKDTDGDGLYAPEEQHYRTGEDSVDTDGDGLSDVEEARGGWTVTLPSGSWFVSSDPAEADQDGDGLDDQMEKAEGTDPTLFDTDRDGLGDGYDPHPLHPARVLHVKEGGSAVSDGLSWETAFGSLTEALLDAKNGNASPDPEDDVAEIWVAMGRYVPSETGDRNASFELSPNISVYGGFNGVETKLGQRSATPLNFPTFLSGDLAGNDAESYAAAPATFGDNSVHVLFAGAAVDANTVLDGFYIVGGNADPAQNGGGMLSNGNPTLKNLFFRTNRANHGAGLFVSLANSQGRSMSITDCLFNRNVAYYVGSANTGGGGAGGGVYYTGAGSTLTLERVAFRENESWGGAGLQLGGGLTAHISETVFDSNDARNFMVPYYQGMGGGAAISGGTTVRFDRCRFTSNQGTYGGGISCGDAVSVQINQTVFWKNKACLIDTVNYGGGGAIYARPDGNFWIVNSTLAANWAEDEYDNITPSYQGQYGSAGGILAAGTASFHIENSIIYANYYTSTDLGTWPNLGLMQIMGGNLKVRTSDVWGAAYLGLAGNGIIDADPAFVDVADGNVNLTADSPCIDKGSNYVDYEPVVPGFQFLPPTDLAGNWRIVDGNGDQEATVDMGPYEYQGD